MLCFSGDPYCPLEAAYKLTRQAIELFREFDIPFTVLSKGGTLAARDFDLYGPNDLYATTLTFLDWEIAVRYEPNAAPPEDRIRALQTAKGRGINTWVSLEPVINAEATIEIIEKTHKFVDLYKIGKLNYQQSGIDWRQFGKKAIATCRKCRTDHYIKSELAAHLKDFNYLGVDNRKRPPVPNGRRQGGRTSLFT